MRDPHGIFILVQDQYTAVGVRSAPFAGLGFWPTERHSTPGLFLFRAVNTDGHNTMQLDNCFWRTGYDIVTDELGDLTVFPTRWCATQTWTLLKNLPFVLRLTTEKHFVTH